MNETPRNIALEPSPNQIHRITLLGKDEFNNPKEEVIFCTPEELVQIESLFRIARADDERL